MKHFLILLTIIVSSAMSLSAKYLKSNEIYSIALSHSPIVKSRSASLDQAYKTQAYTVFNIPDGGFVIVSNSDKAHPILGYSKDGAFDKKHIPYILDQFSEEISYVEEHNVQVKKPLMSRSSSDRQNISPLCASKWDQGIPYNNYCPEMGEYHALTGCVATSMAQIMAYHQYPEHGTGLHHHYRYGDIQLDTCYFDYSKMLIDYPYYETSYVMSVMQHNIANLMKACGYSIDMQYSTSASSASTTAMMNSLIEYFDYSSDAKYIGKSAVETDEEWEDVIYSSLANNCPTEYHGGIITSWDENGSPKSTTATHSWICDGYEDGYFHMNFGWGGSSNGFFKLNSIFDYTLPGYSKVTAAIINLHPNKPNTRKTYSITPTATVSVNTTANISLYNPYIVDGNFEFGYMLTNSSDSIYIPVNDINILSGESTMLTLSESDIKTWENINPGIYKIIPVSDKNEIMHKEESDSIFIAYTPDEIKISKSRSGLEDIVNNMYVKNFNITKLNNRNIEIKSVNPEFDIEVYNFSGKLVYKGNDTNITLPKSGMYIVRNGKANKMITIK